MPSEKCKHFGSIVLPRNEIGKAECPECGEVNLMLVINNCLAEMRRLQKELEKAIESNEIPF